MDLKLGRTSATMAIAFVLAACGSSGAAPSDAPTLQSSVPPSASIAAISPPTATPLPAPATIPILAGEPWVLYGRHLDETHKGLFLVRPDGTDDHRILTELGGYLRAFDWSPDGSQIAFVYAGPDAAKDGEIWTSAADGSGAAKLFDGSPDCSGAYHPGWSPDGRQLAFVCYTADGNGRLSVWDLATATRRDLYRYVWPEHLDNGPRWSPDGSTIVFDILHWDPSNTFLDGSLIATIAAGGGEVTRLTDPALFFSHPSWRPDAKAILVNDYDLGNMPSADHASNLYELALDGTVLRQVTTDSADGTLRIAQASWAPAGDRIWATIWTPGRGLQIRPGWVDPATGSWTALPVVGGSPEMRPAPPSG